MYVYTCMQAGLMQAPIVIIDHLPRVNVMCSPPRPWLCTALVYYRGSVYDEEAGGRGEGGRGRRREV